MLAAYLLGERKVGLKELAFTRLGIEMKADLARWYPGRDTSADYTPMMMAYNTMMGSISPSGSGPASADDDGADGEGADVGDPRRGHCCS